MLSSIRTPVFTIGEIVRTNYGTGPYRIAHISEPCCCSGYIDDSINKHGIHASKLHFHLTCEFINKKGICYLNGFLPTGENIWNKDRLIFPFRSQRHF